ncbi:MAG: nucleotidyltransferase domain-containing protein [Candidatus Pacearchaeota archaeon]
MNINKVLEEEVKKIKLSEEELKNLEILSKLVISAIEHKIKTKRIDADVFIGGSLAKGTLIKKTKQDVDLFIRFDKKYTEKEIKNLLRKIFFWFKLPGIKTKIKRVHGSRDYYKILLGKNKDLVFEIIPNVKVIHPEQARNVTDLSFFHIKYIKDEIKNKKGLGDEILLAKSFCHGQKCYGAESYINGFSGYALELLITYYRSFGKLLREVSKGNEKIIIDPAKYYKNKDEILEKLNPAKTKSPIIIIDPTFKDRNAASALSKETFSRFKLSAKKFLENPSSDFFKHEKINIADLRKDAQNVHGVLAVFSIKTKKQAGDIAGTKLLKFSKFLENQISKYFNITRKEFDYSDGKDAKVYFVLSRKNEIIIEGPSTSLEYAVNEFKKAHPIWYVENSRIYSALPTDISISEFLKEFKKINKKTIKQMSINKIKLA